MTDRGWLGFGGRTRTPQATQHPTASESQSEVGEDTQPALRRTQTQGKEPQQQQQHHHKPPKLSRISSYIGLGAASKSHSPITPHFTIDRSESMKSGTFGLDSEGLRRKNENDVFYNEADATWHNPSLEQMIETVSCEMMRNGSSAPIPRHLNGWIASILEEMSHQCCELKNLRTQFADLRETQQKEIEEFSAITLEWEKREYGFKAEINRLEHIISDTQQGAESVLLVRAGSVVNRNDGRAFRAKLDRLSRSEDDDVALDRNHDYLVDQAKRNSIALSAGNTGLSMDTSPYETLGAVPRIIDPRRDAYLSHQLRYTPSNSKRRPKPEQDLGAKMVAARISVATTGKPPAPSIKRNISAGNSDSSSSSTSSGKVSSSSSLITQGLLAGQVAQGQVTPRTSPIKDEILHGRPDKGPTKGCDVLETIREMAARNGGLPDDAIDDESSYASTPRFSRNLRVWSFDADDDGHDATDCISTTQPSQRSEQSPSKERPSSSQLDGPAQDRGDVTADTTLKDQTSEFFGSSSDGDTNHKRLSALRAMGHSRVSDAAKAKAITTTCRNLDDSAGSVQMTKVMVLQRDTIANHFRVSPTKKVQERRVPRTSPFSTDEIQHHRPMEPNHDHGRAYISDEELALTTLDKPTCGLAQQQAHGYMEGRAGPSPGKRLPSQDAAAAAKKALKSSTSEQRSQRDLQARAQRNRS